MDFDDWLDAVDAIFARNCGGLGKDDFPDNCYWDMFEEGFTPQEAFDSTMEQEGF